MTEEKKTGLTLRAKDVAWILDCSPDDVTMLARKGLLKATKPGHFWRFLEKDVMGYMRRLARQT